MAFLIENDYLHLIRKEILDVVVDSDAKRLEAEEAAEDEIKSYLRIRFNVDFLFKPVVVWSPTVEYLFNEIVYLDATLYNEATDYAADALILFVQGGENRIFRANADPAIGEDPDDTPGKWDLLGKQFDFFQNLQTQLWAKDTVYEVGEFVEFDGDRYLVDVKTTGDEDPTDTDFYTIQTDAVDVGVNPTVTATWTAGDPRKALLVRYMVDVTLYELHSRINPRNIPEFRIQRRDDAIEFLKMAADPRQNVAPAFPEKIFLAKQDAAVVWGSSPQRNHGETSY